MYFISQMKYKCSENLVLDKIKQNQTIPLRLLNVTEIYKVSKKAIMIVNFI